MDFEKEFQRLKRAFLKTSFPSITRKKVLQEMFANAIASGCGLIVYWVLHKFISVKSYRNLWGIAARKDKFLVSPATFEWLGAILAFIAGIFVFTYVEELIHNYINEDDNSEEINNRVSF